MWGILRWVSSSTFVLSASFVLAASIVLAPAARADKAVAPAVDRGLPWTFRSTVMPDEVLLKVTGATRRTRWLWTSTNPLSTGPEGKSFLKFQLTRHEFDTPQAARKALHAVLENADPQMGISYAWDLLTTDGSTLWHLWASCMWSKPNQRKLVANVIREAMGGRKPSPGQIVECTCGGKCNPG
jgi:hypothetical protein